MAILRAGVTDINHSPVRKERQKRPPHALPTEETLLADWMVGRGRLVVSPREVHQQHPQIQRFPDVWSRVDKKRMSR